MVTEIELSLGYENDDARTNEVWFSRRQVVFTPEEPDYSFYMARSKWAEMGCPHYVTIRVRGGDLSPTSSAREES